jgi:hypothetical protein
MNIVTNPDNDFVCLICGTDNKEPVTLIPIKGTEKGNIMEAEVIHIKCIDLTLFKGDDRFMGLQQTFYTKESEDEVSK